MNNQKNTIRNGLLKLEKILEDCDQSHSKVVLGYYNQLRKLLFDDGGTLVYSEERIMLRNLKRKMIQKCNLVDTIWGVREKTS